MPSKKKNTGEKPASERPPTLINGLSKEVVSKEQLEEHIVHLRAQLDREREESNFFQMKKKQIHTFQKISDRKLEEDEAKLKNLERAEEDNEGHHQSEIKLFKQKMKHFLCEHQNTISELKVDGLVSINAWQKDQDELEAEFYKTMRATIVDIQNLDIEKCVRELELKHEKEMATTRDNLERLFTDTEAKNEEKMQLNQQKLECLKIIASSEQQLNWNNHIAALMEFHNNTISTIKESVVDMSIDIMEEVDCGNKLKNLRRTLRKMKQEKHSVQRENCDVTEFISKLGGKIAHSQKIANISSKNEMKMPKRKALENLKSDHEVMEQKFNKLRMERDELSKSFPKKIESVQDKGYLVNRLLEFQLQTLEDDLEKVQAQLHSVLSAPNMDHSTFSEITHKVEEYTKFKNSTIKELENKRNQISKACKDLLLTAGTRALFS